MYCPVLRCHQTSGSVTLRAAMANSPRNSATRKTFFVRNGLFTAGWIIPRWIIPRRGYRYNPQHCKCAGKMLDCAVRRKDSKIKDQGISEPKQDQDVDRCADRGHAVHSRRALLESESPRPAGLP